MSTDAISFYASNTPPLPVRRFTVEEYHRLGEIGVLTPDDRVELLEGWIVEKMNRRPGHGFVVGALNQWQQQSLPEGFVGRCQLPITTERSEPEPDLAVVTGDHKDYRQRHPSGHDCRLLIEVSDTSVERDRAKANIYSTSGVEEYWIVNIAERQLEQYLLPGATAYEKSNVLDMSDTIALQIGASVLCLDLLQLLSDK